MTVIVMAFWLSIAPQTQDTVLVLLPPAAKCAITRNDLSLVPDCAGFTGPGWLTRNQLPGYPPLFREAGLDFTADLTVLIDSLGAVTRFEYRDTLPSGQQSFRAGFRLTLAISLGKWRFVPASKDGHSIPTAIRVVVLWSSESCGTVGGTTQLNSSAHVEPAALVVDVAACTPPLLPSVFH